MNKASECYQDRPLLSWVRSDPEQFFGISGGRFTNVNGPFSLICGLILSVLWYLLLIPIEDTYLAAMFTQRGVIPYCIVFLSSWSCSILAIKWLKLSFQRRALDHQIVPRDPEFVLSPRSVDAVMDIMHATVDDPKSFFLFNRIAISLSNLRNIGRVSDIDDILRSQAEHDESVMETSYALVHGFVWAVPILGFIGTVLGLSEAIGGFGGVLSTTTQLADLKPALQSVTGGLSVAFETTLIGLVAAVLIQLFVTALKKSEAEFLDACTEYCVRNIVGKLRLLPYESRED